MKLEMTEQDDGHARGLAPAARAWRVGRVDIRSPLSRHTRYFARIELIHDYRGRVTDVGTGDSVLNAAFAAVEQILGCKASVASLHSCQRTYVEEPDDRPAFAAIVVERDGLKARGTATGDDLVHASIAAFIDAVCGKSRDCSSLAAGLNMDDDIGLLVARPCQASGIDENGDWWLFASEDAGAAEAVAAEFREEGYAPVRLSLPSNPSQEND